jgi:hypothetical protein
MRQRAAKRRSVKIGAVRAERGHALLPTWSASPQPALGTIERWRRAEPCAIARYYRKQNRSNA